MIKEYGNLPLVSCYLGLLNQVFINIIANAIDALEESCVGKSFAELQVNPRQILIQTEVDQSRNIGRIRITDNAFGMSEEVRCKIFDYLFTTKPAEKGTGLGLSICQQIVVEKHQGQLDCVSKPGVGTVFTITIPLT